MNHTLTNNVKGTDMGKRQTEQSQRFRKLSHEDISDLIEPAISANLAAMQKELRRQGCEMEFFIGGDGTLCVVLTQRPSGDPASAVRLREAYSRAERKQTLLDAVPRGRA